MHWNRSYFPFSQTAVPSTKKRWEMSSGGLGFVTRCLVFGDGNRTTAFFLLKERAWEQAGMEKGPSHTQHWREGDGALAPRLPWGHRSLPALLLLPGRSVKDMSSHQIFTASFRNIFQLLKNFPIAILSCLHFCAITLYNTVKLNAGSFFKRTKVLQDLRKA